MCVCASVCLGWVCDATLTKSKAKQTDSHQTVATNGGCHSSNYCKIARAKRFETHKRLHWLLAIRPADSLSLSLSLLLVVLALGGCKAIKLVKQIYSCALGVLLSRVSEGEIKGGIDSSQLGVGARWSII